MGIPWRAVGRAARTLLRFAVASFDDLEQAAKVYFRFLLRVTAIFLPLLVISLGTLLSVPLLPQGMPGRPILITAVAVTLVASMALALATYPLMVLGYRPSRRTPPSQCWRTSLAGDLTGVVAMDSLVVPTATFRISKAWLPMSRDRRRILHSGTTESPPAGRTARQILAAFPHRAVPRYLLLDRNSIFGLQWARCVDGHRRCPHQPPREGPRLGYTTAPSSKTGTVDTLGHRMYLGYIGDATGGVSWPREGAP